MGLDNPIHLAFLLILLLLVFGAKRLPEMGRSLGAGMRGFRDSLSGEAEGRSLAAAPVAPPASNDAAVPTATAAGARRATAAPAEEPGPRCAA
jgi:sec-independent protein translocase protein TatA